jgi:hypothetical protein
MAASSAALYSSAVFVGRAAGGQKRSIDQFDMNVPILDSRDSFRDLQQLLNCGLRIPERAIIAKFHSTGYYAVPSKKKV